MAEITEAKIRQAIWMLKANKTKKSICEHLGIAYNTKRLDNIIKEFHEKLEREADLKKKARNKIFTKVEKQGIADAYLGGETQSALAKQFHITPQRIKKILMDMNVPIRARGKGKAAQVDHVVQDLEVKFVQGDKVFLARNGMSGKYLEPTEGIHYEIYWMLEGEVLPTRKLRSFLHQREKVSKVIEETGRESYLIYKTDDYGGYKTVTRDKLFPVKVG